MVKRHVVNNSVLLCMTQAGEVMASQQDQDSIRMVKRYVTLHKVAVLIVSVPQ